MKNIKLFFFAVLLLFTNIIILFAEDIPFNVSDKISSLPSGHEILETKYFPEGVITIPNGPTFLTDVTRNMKSPGYWISKLKEPDKIILTNEEISDKNKNTFAHNINLHNIDNYPETVRTAVLQRQQKQILNIFTYRTYLDSSLNKISSSFINKINKNIKIPSKKYIKIKYAITVSYSDVRLLPTDTTFLYGKETFDIDRLQVAGLDLGEPLVVLIQTKDKKWSYVISYISEGWIKTKDIAFTSQNNISKWINENNVAIITNTKADIFLDNKMTKYHDYIRMASKLPIVDMTDKKITCVKIPLKNKKGNLIFSKGYIYNSDLNVNFLEYTQRNVLLQAFKHLNSPYSWGGYSGEQDCSTFVRQIFGCFGLILPRNSSAQIQTGSQQISLKKNSSDYITNKEILNNTTEAISLLYLPGHIMIYIGTEKGYPYVIHSIWGTEDTTEKKEKVISFINRVIVSNLYIGDKTKKGSLLQRITKVNTLK